MQPRNSRPWRQQTDGLVGAFMDQVCCFPEKGTPECGLEWQVGIYQEDLSKSLGQERTVRPAFPWAKLLPGGVLFGLLMLQGSGNLFPACEEGLEPLGTHGHGAQARSARLGRSCPQLSLPPTRAHHSFTSLPMGLRAVTLV